MNEKFGWGTSKRTKFYHKLNLKPLHHIRNRYQRTRWFDCNSWEREPHDNLHEAIRIGLLPCPKCILGKRK